MTDEDDREAHVSAKPSCAQTPARVSRAHGHQKRAKGIVPSSGQGPQEIERLSHVRKAGLPRLVRRADYVFVNKGPRASAATLVAAGRLREGQDGWRVGFTTTKKIGSAVIRNRARRRLKEAARLVLPAHAVSGADYVFFATEQTALAPWPDVLDDMKTALIRLAAKLSGPMRPRGPKPPADNS